MGGATFPFSSVGWCRLASFVRCCCVLHSPFAWCCLPSLPFGGAAFSPSAVWVLLCLLLLWAMLRFSSPSSWCCLPSPPSLSEAGCFLPFFCFLFLWWCYFSLLFCWVVLLGLSLGGVALFPLSFCVVLPSLPFWWGCFLSLFCLRAFFFGDGAAFLFFGWGPLLLEGAALPSLSLGGVLGGATFPFSSVGWCRLASLFGWCCVLHSLLLRGAAFLLLLWVGLLSLSSSLGGVAWPPSLSGVALFPLLLRGAAFLSLLPCVGLVSLTSSVGWCCPPSFPCFPSPLLWVVLLGLLRWVVLRYSLSFCVVLPSFPTFFGRVSFKKKNQKNRKNEVKNKK